MSTARDAQVGLPTWIRQAMALRGVTMRELSDGTGIPYRSMQNYLRGTHTIPAWVIGKVAEFLGVSADWLVSGRGARMDPSIIESGLKVIEDVRGLSGHKVTFEEAAKMFASYYESTFQQKCSLVRPKAEDEPAPSKTAKSRPRRKRA